MIIIGLFFFVNQLSSKFYFFQIFDTSVTRENPAALQDALESCVLFVLISKYDNHQTDMLHRIKKIKELESYPAFSQALTFFAAKEVIPLPFIGQEILEAHPSLPRVGGVDVAARFVETFRTRVVQHNLRVVAGYYKRIRIPRLCELLGLDRVEAEKHLGDLATSGDAYVKIDRPAGIVTFSEPRPPASVLSDWSSDIGQLLSLMESTCHLINREKMVHKV